MLLAVHPVAELARAAAAAPAVGGAGPEVLGAQRAAARRVRHNLGGRGLKVGPGGVYIDMDTPRHRRHTHHKRSSTDFHRQWWQLCGRS